MQIISDFLRRHGIKDTVFAIGVSGGADSLAAALLFKSECPEFRLIALTVDHGLRPTSSDEASYVAKIMTQHDIEHHILVWQGKKPKTGIEEKARLARYDLLCRWCKENGIHYLCVAHHLFDQAETFLMHLQRGSGIKGLSAMNDVVEMNGVFIIRPFLETNPSLFKKFLSDRHIPWIEDESNQCTDLLRVKMRKFLPVMEQDTGISAEKICRAVRNLQNTCQFLEDTAFNIIRQKVHNWLGCGYSVDFSEYQSWHRELKYFILGYLIKKLTGANYVPDAETLQKIISQNETGCFHNFTLGGCHIIRYDLRLWIIPENRQHTTFYSARLWDEFTRQTPAVHGIKLPLKLREVLINKK